MWDANLGKTQCGSTKTDATAATFVCCEPRLLFAAMIFASCKCMESRTPYFLCAYTCHLQLAQSHPPLIRCCCRSYIPAVCQGILFYNHVQQTYSLHEATFTYTSHILVSASLLLVATHTDPSKYFICLSWVYIARYLQCIINTVSACVSQFANLGQIQVWPGLLSRSAVVTRFQRWLIWQILQAIIWDFNENITCVIF